MNKVLFKQIVALFLVLLFSYTALSKLLDHAKFVFQMRLSPIMIIRVSATLLSWIVPFFEFAIAFFLSIGMFFHQILNKGLWLSLILILVFEVYITAMLLSGKNLPCACGGIIELMSWKGHEFFNGVTIIFIVSALSDLKCRLKRKPRKEYLRA